MGTKQTLRLLEDAPICFRFERAKGGTDTARIVVCAQVWNCAQFITAAILPIHEYVDEIFLFDGAYEAMKPLAKVPWSTDGGEDVVQSLNLHCRVEWFDCTEFWKDELTKRRYIMTFLNDGEWWYDLNDDEILTLDVEAGFKKLRNSKARMGYVPRIQIPRARELLEEAPEGTISPYEYMLEAQLRAFRESGMNATLNSRFRFYEDGVHYTDAGISDIRDKDGVHWSKWPRVVLDEMLMWHLKYLRWKPRLQAQLHYEGLPLKLAD